MREVADYNRGEDLCLEGRQKLFEEIEKERGRTLVALCNFDRNSDPRIPGLSWQFGLDVKEPLFRVLKESASKGRGIDLCLYTRGGDTNAVWPIANLLREFDVDYEVLVPFRCHSSGTLLALGARKIIMTPLAELSPIDPTTGNQFNPTDATSKSRLGISVEDVQQYRNFVLEQLKLNSDGDDFRGQLHPFLQRLADVVHPLALGNVHRVHQQIRQLATKLLGFHSDDPKKDEAIVDAMTTRFFSHLHMVSRAEAKEIMGDRVVYAPGKLSESLDKLLRAYEVHFCLRQDLFLSSFMENTPTKSARFIGGAIESNKWSYVLETQLQISQSSVFPNNIQIQLPVGQGLPLVPGLARQFHIEVASGGWVRNLEPKGFDR